MRRARRKSARGLFLGQAARRHRVGPERDRNVLVDDEHRSIRLVQNALRDAPRIADLTAEASRAQHDQIHVACVREPQDLLGGVSLEQVVVRLDPARLGLGGCLVQCRPEPRELVRDRLLPVRIAEDGTGGRRTARKTTSAPVSSARSSPPRRPRARRASRRLRSRSSSWPYLRSCEPSVGRCSARRISAATTDQDLRGIRQGPEAICDSPRLPGRSRLEIRTSSPAIPTTRFGARSSAASSRPMIRSKRIDRRPSRAFASRPRAAGRGLRGARVRRTASRRRPT